MNRKLFSNKEIELLRQNKYIKNVTNKNIIYTAEFKRIFIAEYESGKLPRQIFQDHGFDINILGMERIKSARKGWKKIYEEKGITGFTDTKKLNYERTNDKELSLEEKYARLEAQNHLLKAENELLKKLELIERKLMQKK